MGEGRGGEGGTLVNASIGTNNSSLEGAMKLKFALFCSSGHDPFPMKFLAKNHGL